VAFCGNNTIAVGDSYGEITYVDLTKKKEINKQNAHFGRIGSLNWGKNLLASGSKDGNVGIWDVRCGNVNKYRAHSQEICGLKWSPDGRFIASGGNDNKLMIYSHEKQSEMNKFY
jgi:cell division cycle 20-like protein 1 (cofactor of APC complex)